MWEATSCRLRRYRKLTHFLFILNNMRQRVSALVILTWCFATLYIPDTIGPKILDWNLWSYTKINLYPLSYLCKVYNLVIRKSSWKIKRKEYLPVFMCPHAWEIFNIDNWPDFNENCHSMRFQASYSVRFFLPYWFFAFLAILSAILLLPWYSFTLVLDLLFFPKPALFFFIEKMYSNLCLKFLSVSLICLQSLYHS